MNCCDEYGNCARGENCPVRDYPSAAPAASGQPTAPQPTMTRTQWLLLALLLTATGAGIYFFGLAKTLVTLATVALLSFFIFIGEVEQALRRRSHKP